MENAIVDSPMKGGNTMQKASLAYYFMLIGFVLGNWTARIPAIKDVHNLSDGIFGIVLVAAILGACLCLPVISIIIDKFGSKMGVLSGAAAMLILCPIIGVTEGGLVVLIIGIAGLGFGMGMMDVSCNAQASMFEKSLGEHHMGFFHASYTLGGFFGSILGGVLAQSNISPLENFLLLAIVNVPLCVGFSFWLCKFDEEKTMLGITNSNSHSATTSVSKTSIDVDGSATTTTSEVRNVLHSGNNTIENSTGEGGLKDQNNDNNLSTSLLEEGNRSHGTNADSTTSDAVEKTRSESTTRKSSFLVRNWNIIILCGVASLSAFGEGSMNDWSTIYLTDYVKKESPLLAAVGYAAFELMITIGRLSSDWLVQRLGSATLLRCAGCIACTGMILLVLSPRLPQPILMSTLGLVIAGSGLSVCSPLITSLASRLPDSDPIVSITVVTTCVYLSILAGPPLIGGISEGFDSLQCALLVDGCLLSLISVFACGLASNIDSVSAFKQYTPLSQQDENQH